MKNLKRLQAFLFLSIGIALSAYSLLAMGDFIRSARAILMMGASYQPSSIVPDRIIATILLLSFLAAGVGLIIVSIKGIIESYKK